jgi:hypothetical protein
MVSFDNGADHRKFVIPSAAVARLHFHHATGDRRENVTDTAPAPWPYHDSAKCLNIVQPSHSLKRTGSDDYDHPLNSTNFNPLEMIHVINGLKWSLQDDRSHNRWPCNRKTLDGSFQKLDNRCLRDLLLRSSETVSCASECVPFLRHPPATRV